MLVEFSIVPIGSGSSVGGKVAKVLDIIDKSGLPYRLNPMGTVVEGEWEETLALIKKCRDELLETEERLLISIKIDDRKGGTNRIEAKIDSIEKSLNRTLKK